LERFGFNLSPDDFLNIDESRLREMRSVINTFYQTLPGRLQGLQTELTNLHRRGDLTREEYRAVVDVQNRYNQWSRELAQYNAYGEELQRAEEEQGWRAEEEQGWRAEEEERRRALAGAELPPERPRRSLWHRLRGAFAGGERRGSGVGPPAYTPDPATPNQQHGNRAQLDSGSGLAFPPRYDQAAYTSQEGSGAPQEGTRITARTLERRETVEQWRALVRQQQDAARSDEENTYGDRGAQSR
jgi:hypothetical protein